MRRAVGTIQFTAQVLVKCAQVNVAMSISKARIKTLIFKVADYILDLFSFGKK